MIAKAAEAAEAAGASEAAGPLILSRRDGAIAHVTLNRPRALNALNAEMFAGLSRALTDAAGASAIVLDGAGERGFCGGGDIKQIAAYADPRPLFAAEYRVDYAVHVSPVPVVAVMDGITMGGGIGLGGHAAYRVVTERSRLAMPEARIGIMPDVGGHLLLARAPGRLGEYLALTAAEMTAGDAIALGFADVCVPSARLSELRELLAAGTPAEEALAAVAETAPAAPLLEVLEWFTPLADEALSGIDAAVTPAAAAAALIASFESLGRTHTAAAATAVCVRSMCPVSLAVTLAQLARTRAERLDLAAVLEDDYRIVPRLAVRPNFTEGVRAQLIDKDKSPRWTPATIEELDETELTAILAPFTSDDAPLGLAAAIR